MTAEKLWANSGDSHFIEPLNIFDKLPEHIRDRMPRSVKDPSGEFETIYVDGLEFRRDLPQRDPSKPKKSFGGISARPIGTTAEDFITRVLNGNDAEHRLKDLDDEGVWAEVMYPGLGIWQFNIRTPEVARAGARAINEFAAHFQSKSPRFVCCATLPLVDVDDAVGEVKRCKDEGFLIAFLPVKPPAGRPEWHEDEWAPLWAAFEETGMRIGFHIGTEPFAPTQRQGLYYRGPGGAVLNYVETTYGGQRAVTQLIACGALDRHPELKVLVSEGGATWGPFLADRMDEGYRQHSVAVKPTLSKPPSQFLYEQVYASFQHDSSAVKACSAMGWQNVMWGSDYPHFEGTFGHTQKTLHELFDDVDPVVSHRIRIGAFQELFPSVPAPPFAT
ncbi:MAG: amidohydrolase family protein [Actinobacteria bacterium]|nr:amidohydrolase family protein [Actinomycetota bacterium]MBV9253563.1 amidohydrolase family protein [Actinomycetota bacterium]MBV9666060.1 amidohydrolase family protein [Actinomycetota bacterium]